MILCHWQCHVSVNVNHCYISVGMGQTSFCIITMVCHYMIACSKIEFDKWVAYTNKIRWMCFNSLNICPLKQTEYSLHAHSPVRTHSYIHIPTHTHARTHAHTHTLSLSLSLSVFPSLTKTKTVFLTLTHQYTSIHPPPQYPNPKFAQVQATSWENTWDIQR